MFKEFAQNLYSDQIFYHSQYKWIQVHEANLQMEEAKKIIVELDNELFDKTNTIADLELSNVTLENEKEELEDKVEGFLARDQYYQSKNKTLTEKLEDEQEKSKSLKQQNNELNGNAETINCQLFLLLSS